MSHKKQDNPYAYQPGRPSAVRTVSQNYKDDAAAAQIQNKGEDKPPINRTPSWNYNDYKHHAQAKATSPTTEKKLAMGFSDAGK